MILGSEWITQQIRESPRLRMLVPRVYGLGDLSQIIDERGYAQAVEVLSEFGDDLSKFVVTDAHNLAAHALLKHGFVLLLGEPAAGKSIIGGSLALSAIDLWKCNTIKIRFADDFIRHWNPQEPRQFFWVDDAFGATQYQPQLALDWNRAFKHMAAALRMGAKFLFTSRDYIYKAAQRHLKISAFPPLHEHRVVINVQDLSLSEKEQILYNHIKMGTQPITFKSELKRFLPEVAANPKFLPEIARRLGNPLFTDGLLLNTRSIRNFVEHPVDFLMEVIYNLDPSNQAALAIVFMRGGHLHSPIKLDPQEKEALELLGVRLPDARQAITTLESSLLARVRREGETFWVYKHPTIGDAFARVISSNPELLDMYIKWTKIDQLLSEVTCGDVGIEGVSVIIPPSRFSMIMSRLPEADNQRRLLWFLSSRCSRDFLELYINANPAIKNELVKGYFYVGGNPKVDLLIRLSEFELLPERWRLKFLDTLSTLALDVPDVEFLTNPSIRNMFSESEIQNLLSEIRDQLLRYFDYHIETAVREHEPTEDPFFTLEPLRDTLDILESEYSHDELTIERINRARNSIEHAEQELGEFGHWYPPEGDDWYERPTRTGTRPAHHIFDDVDE